jgi:hypothetical protein
MVQRCEDTGHREFRRYGGRGVTVCAQWHEFENFLADLGERPSGLSLDRIDGDGNYEPGNCRWADWKTQNRNRRSYNHMLTHDGKTMTASAWAEFAGMSQQALYRRLKAGWSVADAITKPLDMRFHQARKAAA